jgi:putative endonuclease
MSQNKAYKKRRALGHRGENAASEFLARQGMKIVDRNWRCSYGEADIIALDKHTLVFCEVKTRKSLNCGSPEDAITLKKFERYCKLVNVYRSRSALRHNAVRFDYVGILVDEARKQARLRYVRDAYANC